MVHPYCRFSGRLVRDRKWSMRKLSGHTVEYLKLRTMEQPFELTVSSDWLEELLLCMWVQWVQCHFMVKIYTLFIWSTIFVRVHGITGDDLRSTVVTNWISISSSPPLPLITPLITQRHLDLMLWTVRPILKLIDQISPTYIRWNSFSSHSIEACTHWIQYTCTEIEKCLQFGAYRECLGIDTSTYTESCSPTDWTDLEFQRNFRNAIQE